MSKPTIFTTSLENSSTGWRRVPSSVMQPVKAFDREHLMRLLHEHIQDHGVTCDLNHIDVSAVTDMSVMFAQSAFNGDLSRWDVSKVVDMTTMFYGSQFNGDVSRWDTSSVQFLLDIFRKSPFRGDVSRWNLEQVQGYERAFSSFNDSLLGYLGVLKGEYSFPEEYPQAARFHELQRITDSLSVPTLEAARYIHERIHHPERVMEGSVVFDFDEHC